MTGRRGGNRGKDVAPERKAEQDAGHQGQHTSGPVLDPCRYGKQCRRAQRQDLDVIAVVGDAVSREKRRREREVEAGCEGEVRAPPRPLGEEKRRAHEHAIEKDGRQRKGPRQLDDEPEGRGQVRLQAAAVRHVGDEHEVLEAIPYAPGDDARQRAIRRDPCRGAVPHQRQAVAKGECDDERQLPGRVRGHHRQERRAAGAQPYDPGDQEYEARNDGRDAKQRLSTVRAVEPTRAQGDPCRRGHHAGHVRPTLTPARHRGWHQARRRATKMRSSEYRGARAPAARRTRIKGTAHGRFQPRWRRSSLGIGESQLSISSR